MSSDSAIEKAIQQFHSDLAPGMQALADALDEAGVSHYSSGCGIKRVTFDIFPASGYVRDMLDMVRLDRSFKSRSDMGLPDASSTNDANPAQQFMLYLRRWSGFAEQVMQQEGDSSRGVAAARAKLIMSELAEAMAPKAAIRTPKMGMKTAPNYNDFFTLMRAIGLHLESNTKHQNDTRSVSVRERMETNYKRAMAAATGSLHKPDSFLVA